MADYVVGRARREVHRRRLQVTHLPQRGGGLVRSYTPRETAARPRGAVCRVDGRVREGEM